MTSSLRGTRSCTSIDSISPDRCLPFDDLRRTERITSPRRKRHQCLGLFARVAGGRRRQAMNAST